MPANDNARQDFSPRPYQIPLIEGAWADLQSGKKEVVLAGAPSAGKTLMAWWLIERLVAEGKRVLVLVHNQHHLKTQFGKEAARFPQINVVLMDSPADAARAAGAQMVVAIPSSLRKVSGDVGRFDVAVVDEAHDFYHPRKWQDDDVAELQDDRGMVQTILTAVGARQRLLLTGTPSVFVKRGLPLHAVSLFELLELGFAADIRVEMAASKFNWKHADWNAAGNLSKEAVDSVTQQQTAATLDEVMLQLVAHARGLAPWHHRAATKLKVARPLGLPDTLGRGIIFCASIRMANCVGKLLQSRGIPALVSHSGNDKKSDNIAAFLRDTSVRALVVADRCRIGFNLPDLTWAADFTGTKDPNLQFQMLCRLTRKADGDPRKLFLKAAPLGHEYAMRAWLEAALNLGDARFYREWDGRMPNDAVVRDPRPRGPGGYDGTEGGTGGGEAPVPEPPPEGMFVRDFMQNVKHHHADPLAVTHMTTLGEARVHVGEISHRTLIWDDFFKVGKPQEMVPKFGPEDRVPLSDEKCEWIHKGDHSVWATYANIYGGKGCGVCRGLQGQSHEKNRIAVERHGLLLYPLGDGDPLPKVGDKLLFPCAAHGHKAEKIFDSAKRGSGCGVCSGLVGQSHEKNRVAVEKHGKLLYPLGDGDPLPKSADRLLFPCFALGHKTEKTLSMAKQGQGCGVCANQQGQSHEKNRISVERHGLLLYPLGDRDPLPKDKDKLLFPCIALGHKAEKIFSDAKQGEGCVVCRNINSSIRQRANGKPLTNSAGQVFGSLAEATEATRVCRSSIGHAISGRYKNAGGLVWRYLTKKEAAAWNAADRPERMDFGKKAS